MGSYTSECQGFQSGLCHLPFFWDSSILQYIMVLYLYYDGTIFHSVCTTMCVPLLHWWTFGFFPQCVCNELCCCEHRYTRIWFFSFLDNRLYIWFLCHMNELHFRVKFYAVSHKISFHLGSSMFRSQLSAPQTGWVLRKSASGEGLQIQK